MENSNEELYNLIKFYEKDIMPFSYTYNCGLGININIVFEPSEICHLIFGSLKGKNIPNAKNYKGINGYTCILDKIVTQPHHSLKKAYQIKSSAFYCLPDLLSKPDLIIFNKNIAGKGKSSFRHLEPTDIDGDFLLYKKIDNKIIHFFIKWDDRQNRFVPYSLFHNKKDNYLENQIRLNLICSPNIANRTIVAPSSI